MFVDLSDDYDTCTPKGILETDELITIPECSKEATQWDVEYANNIFSRKDHCNCCLQVRQQLLSDPGFGHILITYLFVLVTKLSI